MLSDFYFTENEKKKKKKSVDILLVEILFVLRSFDLSTF